MSCVTKVKIVVCEDESIKQQNMYKDNDTLKLKPKSPKYECHFIL